MSGKQLDPFEDPMTLCSHHDPSPPWSMINEHPMRKGCLHVSGVEEFD